MNVSKQDHLYEKTIASQPIYEGRIISLKVDEVLLPNGHTAKREIVNHPGAVAVMALTDDNKLVAVRQFRKPLEQTIVEIPAGKLEPGEEPLTCAKRELEEETGYVASHYEPLSSFYTSPGFADEILHVFVATGLKKGESKPDEDEFVDALELTLEEAHALHRSGEIRDAKTVVALFAWENMLLRKQLNG
ncbi:NUDIX hydrolase [Brevibacillus agri]|uniref:NUDIX domain-containing protein n=1 Tax=Brevibacillus sp. NSP2.1 TaxID=3003229 RepID=UPI000554D981|nr:MULTISPECIES: NUDIX hydrolase [Brevibacillus]MBG9569046.1 ADP-ribose pyrophosphatase [Brevibacillus agri]MBY0050490.1 NUDIX hydrolase [Brevibacillus agri]MCG5249922.1 NUDIX hydrolase [Brevibacillus agri]MDN4091506.1 NUDIX hydrolase [Brevibacillus agri]MDR9503061.1 NUDIX hydrolase [Brevibacillus agri]